MNEILFWMKSCTGVNGPHREKTCLRDLRPGKVQVRLLSCRDYREFLYVDHMAVIRFRNWKTKVLIRPRMRTFVVLIHINILISLTTRQVPA